MATLGITALLTGTKGDLDKIRDQMKGQVNSSIFYVGTQRYTDYVIATQALQPDSHTGLHSERSSLLYDPQGNGDKWCNLKMMITLPAISRNPVNNSYAANPGRNEDAYWVNNVGFAIIKDICIRSGNVDGPLHTDKHLWRLYNETQPEAHLPMDLGIGRHQVEGTLKQAAGGNQILMVPIPMYNFQQKRAIHNAFPLNWLTAQPTLLKVTYRTIAEIVVNEMDETARINPALKGTAGATIIDSSYINISFISNFIIMSPYERQTQKDMIENGNGQYTDLHYFSTQTRISNETAGTGFTFELDLNHTINAFRVYFQSDQWIDGSAKSPVGVGRKNYFDYSASHGGETLYGFELLLNSVSASNKTEPVTFRSSTWYEYHNQTPMYSKEYIFSVDVKGIDNLTESHTWNPSFIERVKLTVIKNISEAGTLFVDFHTKNVWLSQGYYGGIQYQG